MRSTARKRLGTAVLISTALAGCPAALAAVQIDGTLIQGSELKTKAFDRSLPGNTGGTLSCSKDKRILNGGAFWHQPLMGPDPALSDTVRLTSSAPLSGRTWYADGKTGQPNPRTLTVEVRCLPKGKLRGVVTRTKSKTLKSGTYGEVHARCPQGLDPISGGTFISEPGKAPKPSVSAERGRITGSYPGFHDWRGIGGNFSNGKLALSAVARCFPEDRFDGSAALDHPTVSANATGGGYLDCGGARAALTGGVWWSTTGESEPDPALSSQTYLSGNATTFQVNGHYAAGLNQSSETLNLDSIAVCPAL